MPVGLGVGKALLAPDCHQLVGEREALREALGARHDPRVRGQHGCERLGIPDTARHRQGSTDHRPAFAVGHAGECLLRQETLQPCPDRAVTGRQQRERLAQKRDHFGVLLDEVRPVQAQRQQGLGHALAIVPGLGRGGEGAQELVGALVPRELEDAAALELEVEPLGLPHVGEPFLRAQGTLVLLSGDVEGQLRRRLVARRSRVAHAAGGVDERSGGGEVRRQVTDRDGPRRGRSFERLRDPRVQPHAPAGRQLVHDRLPHHRVREAEAIQALVERISRARSAASRASRADSRSTSTTSASTSASNSAPATAAASRTWPVPSGNRASRQRTTSRTRGVSAVPGSPFSPSAATTSPTKNGLPSVTSCTRPASEAWRPECARIAATSVSASGPSSSLATSGRRARPVTTSPSRAERLGSVSR